MPDQPEQPEVNARRKMLRDLLGFAVGGAVTVAAGPVPALLGAGRGEAQPETPPPADPLPLHVLQGRLAEKTGLSYRQIDESRLDDLLSNLRTAILRGGETIRIPREKFVSFLATYAGAQIYQEKRVYVTDVQFSKEENGRTFDIVAHASFGRLFVQVSKVPVSEAEVSEFSRMCDTFGIEEGWLVAPGLETKLIRGEPVRLWENRYVIPVVRLMSYETVFDWLLSPVVPALRRNVIVEDQAVILLLSPARANEGREPQPGHLPEEPKKEGA